MNRDISKLSHDTAEVLNTLANSPPSDKTANQIHIALTRLAALIPEITSAIRELQNAKHSTRI